MNMVEEDGEFVLNEVKKLHKSIRNRELVILILLVAVGLLGVVGFVEWMEVNKLR